MHNGLSHWLNKDIRMDSFRVIFGTVKVSLLQNYAYPQLMLVC